MRKLVRQKKFKKQTKKATNYNLCIFLLLFLKRVDFHVQLH